MLLEVISKEFKFNYLFLKLFISVFWVELRNYDRAFAVVINPIDIGSQ